MQRHFGEVHRPSRRRPLEDDLLHLGSTEETCALLAEHPAHCIGDVRFSTTVRADDCRDTGLEVEIRRVRERLETVELELGQPH